MLENLVIFAQSNQQVAAAITLIIGGVVGYIVRDVPRQIWKFIRTQSTCVVDMDNTETWGGKNDRMDRFMDWYLENGLTWFNRQFRMSKKGNYEAGNGTHLFIWKHRLFWFRIIELDSNGVHFRKRIVRIHMLGRDSTMIKNLISEVTKPSKVEKTHITVFQVTADGQGSSVLASAQLPIVRDFVPLVNGEVYRSIKTILDRFSLDAQWFKKHNAPLKRTFFFYGPPGTGKSTLAMQIAMMTGRDVYVIPSTIYRLNIAVANVPSGSVILFEDVHSNVELCTRDVRAQYEREHPSFLRDGSDLSVFLNVLSGPIPLDNQIVVITTNYKERLDPAIYRPGRVDLDVEIGYLTSSDIHAWFTRTYGDAYLEHYPYEVPVPKGLTTGYVFQQYEIYRDDFHGLRKKLLSYSPETVTA